jgi:hypothetical protein
MEVYLEGDSQKVGIRWITAENYVRKRGIEYQTLEKADYGGLPLRRSQQKIRILCANWHPGDAKCNNRLIIED